MGQGSKPAKKNDRPIISTPRAKGSGQGGGSQKTLDLNQTCPVQFDVALTANPLLRKGNALHIDNRGNVLLDNHVVGKVSAQQFRKVSECLEHGYVYRGRVEVDKKKKLYGRFERSNA